MKQLFLIAAVCLLQLTGCSNLPEKRMELASAGFQTIPATTPAQLAKLAALRSSKVVPVNGKRGTVYIFADHQHKALMVGSPAQYQKYRAIKLHQQKIDEQLLDAQVNMDNADWSAWGPYAGWGWSVASDPL
jgi:hypothetical protein